MSALTAYVIVFVLAAVPWLEVLLVVPAGVLAGLAPVPTVAVAAAGNIATLIPVVIAGDRIRGAWRRRRARTRTPQPPDAVTGDGDPGGQGTSGAQSGARATGARSPEAAGGAQGDEHGGRSGRARRVFDRYGVPGLALLGPLLTGVHVAALVAIAAGARRRPSVVWLSAGVVLWAAAAAAATVLGLDALAGSERLTGIIEVS